MTQYDGHNLPLQDMMPAPRPTEKETMYKTPSQRGTRKKEGHIL